MIATHPDCRFAPTSTKLHVLVVEENLDGATSLAELVQLHGHEAEVALDGEAALRAAQRTHPDVVFLDLGLPRVDGIQVARQMQQVKGKKPFFIALTGYSDDSHRGLSQEAGIDVYLVKPVDPDQLMNILDRFSSVLFETCSGR